MVKVSRRSLLFGAGGVAVAAAGAGYWAMAAGPGFPKTLANLSGSEGGIVGPGVVFSPDGRELAGPAGPYAARWDTATWRELAPLVIGPDVPTPSCCEYSPDGSVIAVAAGALFIMDRRSASVRQRVAVPSRARLYGEPGFFVTVSFSLGFRRFRRRDGLPLIGWFAVVVG